MRFLLTIFSFASLFIVSTDISLSQGVHTSSNRAMKFYNEGVSAYDYFDYTKAEANFKEAISIDDKFYEAYMMIGELMFKLRRYDESSKYFRKAIKIDSLFYKPAFFNIAKAEMMSGDYSNALIHFNVYLLQEGMSEGNTKDALKYVENCKFALEAIKSPVPFSPVSVGDSINTKDDEYWPSITADGNTMMFTRQHGRQSQEDFYISYNVNGVWQKAFNAGAPINTRQNEGAQTISSNGAYMFYTACDRPGGIGRCDIYFSAFNDGKWSEPSNLRFPVNTSSWESQPSISSDGKVLYFSSNRPGGKGGMDIWLSKMNERNVWTYPVNLGDKINTEGDEMSPFIHFDNKTLYFASNGKIGMGGFDIFMTRLNEDDTVWTEPVNLGYPINTHNDEMGLIIESGGTKAFFSSVRDKKNGKDIFCFDLYEEARPNPVSYLKGSVRDRVTGKLLKAYYELFNLTTNKILMKSSTDRLGNFLICLPSGYNYGINVSKEGYLFYSDNFMLEEEHSVAEPYIKKINLSPIKQGEGILLSNVFYEVDSWQLKTESISELNNLVTLLSDNKGLVIEIEGYTDSTGSDEYNLILSEKRALSVVNYLISRGISAERLKYKGYGNSSPIGDNITAEGRKLNRRTVAKIIE